MTRDFMIRKLSKRKSSHLKINVSECSEKILTFSILSILRGVIEYIIEFLIYISLNINKV